jgi:hypothetical protein
MPYVRLVGKNLVAGNPAKKRLSTKHHRRVSVKNRHGKMVHVWKKKHRKSDVGGDVYDLRQAQQRIQGTIGGEAENRVGVLEGTYKDFPKKAAEFAMQTVCLIRKTDGTSDYRFMRLYGKLSFDPSQSVYFVEGYKGEKKEPLGNNAEFGPMAVKKWYHIAELLFIHLK